jgi:hypothetical protein
MVIFVRLPWDCSFLATLKENELNTTEIRIRMEELLKRFGVQLEAIGLNMGYSNESGDRSVVPDGEYNLCWY